MSSYASIRAFSHKVKADLPRLDVLIANAGLTTRAFRTTEANEETITTNVVSLFLLILLLHSKLRDTSAKYSTRIHITVTESELHVIAKFQERKAPAGQIFAVLNDETKANMPDRYSVSKLLVIFTIKQIAALSPLISSGVTVNCIDSG